MTSKHNGLACKCRIAVVWFVKADSLLRNTVATDYRVKILHSLNCCSHVKEKTAAAISPSSEYNGFMIF